MFNKDGIKRYADIRYSQFLGTRKEKMNLAFNDRLFEIIQDVGDDKAKLGTIYEYLNKSTVISNGKIRTNDGEFIVDPHYLTYLALMCDKFDAYSKMAKENNIEYCHDAWANVFPKLSKLSDKAINDLINYHFLNNDKIYSEDLSYFIREILVYDNREFNLTEVFNRQLQSAIIEDEGDCLGLLYLINDATMNEKLYNRALKLGVDVSRAKKLILEADSDTLALHTEWIIEALESEGSTNGAIEDKNFRQKIGYKDFCNKVLEKVEKNNVQE